MHARRYLRQIAVITPYAEFKFTYTTEDEKGSMKTTFARRTDKMPAPPKVSLGQKELQVPLIAMHTVIQYQLCRVSACL